MMCELSSSNLFLQLSSQAYSKYGQEQEMTKEKLQKVYCTHLLGNEHKKVFKILIQLSGQNSSSIASSKCPSASTVLPLVPMNFQVATQTYEVSLRTREMENEAVVKELRYLLYLVDHFKDPKVVQVNKARCFPVLDQATALWRCQVF